MQAAMKICSEIKDVDLVEYIMPCSFTKIFHSVIQVHSEKENKLKFKKASYIHSRPLFANNA